LINLETYYHNYLFENSLNVDIFVKIPTDNVNTFGYFVVECDIFYLFI